MSKIVETIHHGSYRNTRTTHIHPVNVPDIAEWLRECPYGVTGVEVEGLAGRLCSIAASVHDGSDRSIDRGWIHWEVS